MLEYTSINDFINNCNLFTSKEKQEIIKEAVTLEVNVLDYIDFEINSLKQVKQEFKNQINLI